MRRWISFRSARSVALDEVALVGVARADVVHHVRRVGADARRQVVDEALGVGQPRFVGDLDDDREVVQAGGALAQLVEGADARRVAREELLDLAAQVRVEPHRPRRSGDAEDQREDPDEPSVAQQPLDVAAHRGRRARAGGPHDAPSGGVVEGVPARP